MLYDQIEEAVDRARTGQRISLSVRATHWYQDLVLTPRRSRCVLHPGSGVGPDEVRHLLGSLNEPEPPRAVWLTHDAGRLPGLAAALHQNMTEKTNVRVLHPEAAARAVANLNDRWGAGNCRLPTSTRRFRFPRGLTARVPPRSPVVRR